MSTGMNRMPSATIAAAPKKEAYVKVTQAPECCVVSLLMAILSMSECGRFGSGGLGRVEARPAAQPVEHGGGARAGAGAEALALQALGDVEAGLGLGQRRLGVGGLGLQARAGAPGS